MRSRVGDRDDWSENNRLWKGRDRKMGWRGRNWLWRIQSMLLRRWRRGQDCWSSNLSSGDGRLLENNVRWRGLRGNNLADICNWRRRWQLRRDEQRRRKWHREITVREDLRRCRKLHWHLRIERGGLRADIISRKRRYRHPIRWQRDIQ